jgi:hypothetical protein
VQSFPRKRIQSVGGAPREPLRGVGSPALGSPVAAEDWAELLCRERPDHGRVFREASARSLLLAGTFAG